jgi:hypothetical protein
LQNLADPPPFGATDRPTLHDEHGVAYTALVLFIVSGEPFAPPHKFLIDGVFNQPLYSDNDCFVHGITNNDASERFGVTARFFSHCNTPYLLKGFKCLILFHIAQHGHNPRDITSGLAQSHGVLELAGGVLEFKVKVLFTQVLELFP